MPREIEYPKSVQHSKATIGGSSDFLPRSYHLRLRPLPHPVRRISQWARSPPINNGNGRQQQEHIQRATSPQESAWQHLHRQDYWSLVPEMVGWEVRWSTLSTPSRSKDISASTFSLPPHVTSTQPTLKTLWLPRGGIFREQVSKTTRDRPYLAGGELLKLLPTKALRTKRERMMIALTAYPTAGRQSSLRTTGFPSTQKMVGSRSAKACGTA